MFLFFPGVILLIFCVFGAMNALCELITLICVHVPSFMLNLVGNIVVSVSFLLMKTNSSFCFSISSKIDYNLPWLFFSVPPVICSLAVFVMTLKHIGILYQNIMLR